MEVSALIAVIGMLVAVCNIITEVLKKLTWDKLPTNILAIIIAQVLTLGVGIAYWQISGYILAWYVVAAMVVVGFMVAYAAMFGFDKLQEIMNWKNKYGDGK